MPERLPRREVVGRLLSASAGLVAVCALAVSGYQTYIMRQQLKMSAWPYLDISNSTSEGSYERFVTNVGLGPALVRSVTLTVDGRPMHDWREVGAELYGDSVAAVARRDSATLTTSTLRQGTVLLPGATVHMLRLTGRTMPDVLGHLLMGTRATMRVCYCSLYGDCWVAAQRQREPAPVRACAADSTREFAD